jgi:formylglycine-generating enzyme required for sulfatase activity
LTQGAIKSKDHIIDMEFVFVKGGCYDMGDTFGDGESDEKPVRNVCISDFSIGKYEVTQKQWKSIMGSNPSDFSSCGETCPVEMVSWNDIEEFIQKLNSATGKSYRLPTEAEWEYAARSGGKKEKYAGTSSDPDLINYAWYSSNSDDETHPAGRKKPNGLGIYDMSGNVYEWCHDWFSSHYYKNRPANDPQGPSSGDKRVFRGGSWLNEPMLLRASDRNDEDPSVSHHRIGFRLVRTR